MIGPDDVGVLLTDIHNRSGGEICRLIVRPTMEAGGDITDVLVLLESVIIGVMLCVVKMGGDNRVLDLLITGVRQRLAEIRLGDTPAAGES